MPRGPKTPPSLPFIDPANPAPGIKARFKDWMTKKHLAKDLTAAEKEANNFLKEIVQEHGSPDDKGHIWLDLGEEVEGWDSKGAPAKFNALQCQRRVSLIIDEPVAIGILEPKGLLAEATNSYIQVTDAEKAITALAKAGLLDGAHGVEVTTEVVEDKVVGLYFQDKITEEEYNAIVTPKVTWALYPGTLS